MDFQAIQSRVGNAGALSGIAIGLFILVDVLFGPFPSVRDLLQSPVVVLLLVFLAWVAAPMFGAALQKTPKFNALWAVAVVVAIALGTLIIRATNS